VSTTDACTAAGQVRSKAGVRPLDSVDTTYINMVTLGACSSSLRVAME
jgi:hypothetical protein